MTAKIGLLPLYIKLYDDGSPELRPKVEKFYAHIAQSFTGLGIETLTVPVCRIKDEFDQAIKYFEESGVDAVVTLHLAYSPSLESAAALAGTELPIIVLDTTPDYMFDFYTDPDLISYNHGIHGVQDMCNMLRRSGKKFEIFAGHHEHSDVLRRVAAAAEGAALAAAMRRSKIAIYGKPFAGMGDFAIGSERLTGDLGITVIPGQTAAVTEEEIDGEIATDPAGLGLSELGEEGLRDNLRVSLGVRHFLEDSGATGFTANFLDSGSSGNFAKMPFYEACVQMFRGIGYGGEGDIMTAALVGALLRYRPRTSFAEMFCPDWSGDRIFFSHMGEFNPAAADPGSLHCKLFPFIYSDSGITLSVKGAFSEGDALFTCLAPRADGYTLIICPGTMCHVPEDHAFGDSVAGWFKPEMPVAELLEQYSRSGGIHHGALVYDGDETVLRSFASAMGWDCVVIG